ncbi:hypothetical protein MLD52_06980 [Puniceicoccaceae bacterium K14]|nr:hypothetical protein [Puniceicoccaceae bacterium K14]
MKNILKISALAAFVTLGSSICFAGSITAAAYDYNDAGGYYTESNSGTSGTINRSTATGTTRAEIWKSDDADNCFIAAYARAQSNYQPWNNVSEAEAQASRTYYHGVSVSDSNTEGFTGTLNKTAYVYAVVETDCHWNDETCWADAEATVSW